MSGLAGVEARAHLESLVGQEIRTLTGNRPNRILRLEGDEVIVGTAKSPEGTAVPIQWVQDAIDLLVRDGEVTVDVETLGYRTRSSALSLRLCRAQRCSRRLPGGSLSSDHD